MTTNCSSPLAPSVKVKDPATWWPLADREGAHLTVYVYTPDDVGTPASFHLLVDLNGSAPLDTVQL